MSGSLTNVALLIFYNREWGYRVLKLSLGQCTVCSNIIYDKVCTVYQSYEDNMKM